MIIQDCLVMLSAAEVFGAKIPVFVGHNPSLIPFTHFPPVLISFLAVHVYKELRDPKVSKESRPSIPAMFIHQNQPPFCGST